MLQRSLKKIRRFVNLKHLHSVLWLTLLVGRQEGRPTCKKLRGSRCRFAHGPDDATATHYLLISKSRLVLLFWFYPSGASRYLKLSELFKHLIAASLRFFALINLSTFTMKCRAIAEKSPEIFGGKVLFCCTLHTVQFKTSEFSRHLQEISNIPNEPRVKARGCADCACIL